MSPHVRPNGVNPFENKKRISWYQSMALDYFKNSLHPPFTSQSVLFRFQKSEALRLRELRSSITRQIQHLNLAKSPPLHLLPFPPASSPHPSLLLLKHLLLTHFLPRPLKTLSQCNEAFSFLLHQFRYRSLLCWMRGS